jgi:hypothetical protein
MQQSGKLKQEFIQFYLSGNHPSRANAAQRFCASLPKERREILSKDNAERTLLDALRAYEKRLRHIQHCLLHTNNQPLPRYALSTA